MTFSGRARRAALVLCALAILCPAVVSAQSTSDSTTSLPALDFSRVTTFIPGQSFSQLQQVGVLFGVWDEGSLTAGDIVAMWVHNFHRVKMDWHPAPSITHTPRFVQGAHTNSSTTLDIGIVAEGGFVFSDTTVTYTGGPRVTFMPAGWPVAIYGEVLAGGLSFDGGTDFLLMPAAGVTIPLGNSKFSIVGEIGFPIDYFDGGHETATRYMGGFLYRLGK